MIELSPAEVSTAGKNFLHAVPQEEVRRWIAEMAQMCQPDRLRVLSGGPSERQVLIDQAVADGVLIRLNQTKLPGCYLHRSNPNDVARTEQCTFICTPGQDAAGPTNNWMEP